MAQSDAHDQLKAVLSEHLDWHGARTGFLAYFLLSILQVRTVNLAQVALGFGGNASEASNYKRLQRFFRAYVLDEMVWARLLVNLLPDKPQRWLLSLDRTHWKFGQTDHNLLVLGLVYKGFCIPLFWRALDKAGNSNTQERQEVLQCFLDTFGAQRIEALLADREFTGQAWFDWLRENAVPFHIRVKSNYLVPDDQQNLVQAKRYFASLKVDQVRHRPLVQENGDAPLTLTALRLENDWLLIVTCGAQPQPALEHYRQRWSIETLFGCLKSRGFNLEDTHLRHPERLSRLFALLALVFVWALRTGQIQQEKQPIPQKKRSNAPLNLSSVMASI